MNELLDMVDAMLLPDTVPHDIVEIGRMAEDGSLPGPAASIEQVSGWLKDRNLKPIRHARKSTMTLPPMPPLSAGEVIAAGKPARNQPTVINMPQIVIPAQEPDPGLKELAKAMMAVAEASSKREPPAAPVVNIPPQVINIPPQQESPAMMAMAAAMSDVAQQMAKAVNRPHPKPPDVIFNPTITTPEVVFKPNINVEAAKPANVKVDVHQPAQRKIKSYERDKNGDIVRPIYEEEEPNPKTKRR